MDLQDIDEGVKPNKDVEAKRRPWMCHSIWKDFTLNSKSTKLDRLLALLFDRPAAIVFAILCDRHDGELIYIPVKDIMDSTGLSKKAAILCLNKLIELGLIVRHKVYGNTMYELKYKIELNAVRSKIDQSYFMYYE